MNFALGFIICPAWVTVCEQQPLRFGATKSMAQIGGSIDVNVARTAPTWTTDMTVELPPSV